MIDNKRKGDIGERLAIEYLLKNGYSIVEKNYKIGKIEIDIIAEKKGVLIFFEVKTRSEKSWDSNFTSWKNKQRKNFIFGVKSYLYNKKIIGKKDIRFDFIAIKADNWELVHFKNAMIA